MERAVFDRMAELDQEHWWFLARRRILDRLIERVVRPPVDARVLEVGCGTGHNLAMLGRFGTVDACELDKCARALASKRLGKRVKDARLPVLSMFERNGYDMVALLDVLEHVPDDIGSLRAIHRRLKPGGALLLTVPPIRGCGARATSPTTISAVTRAAALRGCSSRPDWKFSCSVISTACCFRRSLPRGYCTRRPGVTAPTTRCPGRG
jgi:SAM-dependent methyltransferase